MSYHGRTYEPLSVSLLRQKFKETVRNSVLGSVVNVDSEPEEEDDGVSSAQGIGSKNPPAHQKGPPGLTMRIFDRALDISQFNIDTPLYPMCRTWLKNDPKSSKKEEEAKNDEEEVYGGEEVNPQDVNSFLPKPEPLPRDIFGKEIKLRIPAPLPSDNELFVIDYVDGHEPSPPILFQNHLHRWGAVRRRWMDACAANERRYAASFRILESMQSQTQ